MGTKTDRWIQRWIDGYKDGYPSLRWMKDGSDGWKMYTVSKMDGDGCPSQRWMEGGIHL